MIDPKDDRIASLERALGEARARIAEVEAKALDLEDALVRAESQTDVLENFCFGLERDHDRARRAIEERDAQILAELEQARGFQKAMLSVPPAIDGVTLDVAYRPVSQVGGDFFDVTTIGPSTLRLFIADATGHGMKAALQTMLIKAEYEAASGHAAGPADLLALLNAKIHRAYRGIDVLFTAAAVDVDLVTGAVRYACAAHPGPLLLRDGSAVELPEVDGSFIGLSAAATFEEAGAELEPGGAIVLLTDGITEASRPGAGEFGEARVLRAMEQAHASRRPITSAVSSALDAFLYPDQPDDDVTLIALARR